LFQTKKIIMTLDQKSIESLFHEKFIERTAKISINSSSMRNQGKSGTIAKIRKYLLQNVKLQEISKLDELKSNY